SPSFVARSKNASRRFCCTRYARTAIAMAAATTSATSNAGPAGLTGATLARPRRANQGFAPASPQGRSRDDQREGAGEQRQGGGRPGPGEDRGLGSAEYAPQQVQDVGCCGVAVGCVGAGGR